MSVYYYRYTLTAPTQPLNIAKMQFNSIRFTHRSQFKRKKKKTKIASISHIPYFVWCTYALCSMHIVKLNAVPKVAPTERYFNYSETQKISVYHTVFILGFYLQLKKFWPM